AELVVEPALPVAELVVEPALPAAELVVEPALPVAELVVEPALPVAGLFPVALLTVPEAVPVAVVAGPVVFAAAVPTVDVVPLAAVLTGAAAGGGAGFVRDAALNVFAVKSVPSAHAGGAISAAAHISAIAPPAKHAFSTKGACPPRLIAQPLPISLSPPTVRALNTHY